MLIIAPTNLDLCLALSMTYRILISIVSDIMHAKLSNVLYINVVVTEPDLALHFTDMDKDVSIANIYMTFWFQVYIIFMKEKWINGKIPQGLFVAW